MGLFKFNKKNDQENQEQEPVENTTSNLKGDRNDINVSGRSKGSKRVMLAMLFLAGVILMVIFISVTYLKKPEEKTFEASKSDKEQYQRRDSSSKSLSEVKERQARINKTLDDVKGDVKSESDRAVNVDKVQEDKKTKDPEPSESAVVADMPANDNYDDDTPTPKQRRLMGKTLVAVDNIASPASEGSNNGQQGGFGDDDGDFLQGSSFSDGSVARLKNRSYLLPAGTAASCVLKTKIITSYPAFTMCQLTKNIYSDNGENILVRAGAEFHGQQTRVMKQGVARVFINWTNIKDRNMNIRVDALGADGLGASGLPAWVDNHFWERFGGSIMLSFIEDAIAAAASQATKSNSSDGVNVNNTENAASEMASIALENSINIPPTAIINQGEMLTVIVPRYVDFSKVYR